MSYMHPRWPELDWKPVKRDPVSVAPLKGAQTKMAEWSPAT